MSDEEMVILSGPAYSLMDDSKCVICGQSFGDDEEQIDIRGGWAHPGCFWERIHG